MATKIDDGLCYDFGSGVLVRVHDLMRECAQVSFICFSVLWMGLAKRPTRYLPKKGAQKGKKERAHTKTHTNMTTDTDTDTDTDTNTNKDTNTCPRTMQASASAPLSCRQRIGLPRRARLTHSSSRTATAEGS